MHLCASWRAVEEAVRGGKRCRRASRRRTGRDGEARDSCRHDTALVSRRADRAQPPPPRRPDRPRRAGTGYRCAVRAPLCGLWRADPDGTATTALLFARLQAARLPGTPSAARHRHALTGTTHRTRTMPTVAAQSVRDRKAPRDGSGSFGRRRLLSPSRVDAHHILLDILRPIPD